MRCGERSAAVLSLARTLSCRDDGQTLNQKLRVSTLQTDHVMKMADAAVQTHGLDLPGVDESKWCCRPPRLIDRTSGRRCFSLTDFSGHLSSSSLPSVRLTCITFVHRVR